MNEGAGPDITVWVQSLKDNISMLTPRTVRESKRIELMKHQLGEVRRASNRLRREIVKLEEENQLLQEKKENEPKD
jgi:hypothetical protein